MTPVMNWELRLTCLKYLHALMSGIVPFGKGVWHLIPVIALVAFSRLLTVVLIPSDRDIVIINLDGM